MGRADVKTRLSTVPVYTVANTQNEFVLVSNQKDQAPTGNASRLGLFFFNKDDAQKMIDKIGEQDKSLARDARVQALTMDMVYDVFSNRSSDESLRGVNFRFMPDRTQVQAAMSLYSDAGHKIESFNGIPVFQAEGLYVNTETKKYTPIFLDKADLDAALGNAHTTRKKIQASDYAARADSYQVEFEKASKEFAEAADEKAQRRARERAEKAQLQEEKARNKARKVERSSLPKIEVGCFEEVITSMERDRAHTWDSVMFIPPGSLSRKK